MDEAVPRTIGTIIYYVCTFGALSFVVLYATLAPWWRSIVGRHMMAFMVVLAGILSYGTVVPLLGLSLEQRLWSRVIAFTLFGGVIWWRVWLVVALQVGNLRSRGSRSSTRGTTKGSRS